MSFDISILKSAARGRWRQLLCMAGNIDPESLDGRHHPCPKCGGKDRFRALDDFEETGAVLCNQCFNKGNGDGIAAVMWLSGFGFAEAVRGLAGELGLAADSPDAVEEMAWRKVVPSDALRDYGAHVASRGDTPVCRIPMYDADMQKTGDFDMSPASESLQKGMMTKGSKHGLFVAKQPTAGDTVAVVEGVKDAAALHSLGIAAVGLPTCRMDGGFARMFRGCNVVIIPDRDKAGTDGANETGGVLFGVAASVKVAELPAEFKDTGGADVRDVLRMKDGEAKLRSAIANAVPWSPVKSKPDREVVLVSLEDAVAKYLDSLESQEVLLHLGLPLVDEALSGGVLRGETIIIAGRPSHGKTMVAMQALDALSLQVPVLMISEEMSVSALAKRTVSSLTDSDRKDWKLCRDELIAGTQRHFAGHHPYVIAESCGTVERAIQAIEKAKTAIGIGAVVVDYVQLLRGCGQGRYEQVSDVSTRLKQAAVRNDVVLIAVCQLNRGVETRQGNRSEQKTSAPRMSDLRDSGQLEQDADVILFVEWLHRTTPDAHKQYEYRILVAKNRNRPIAKWVIDCAFRPDRQRIYTLDEYRQPGEASRYPEFDQFGNDTF